MEIGSAADRVYPHDFGAHLVKVESAARRRDERGRLDNPKPAQQVEHASVYRVPFE
jgi:hypothetical protein